MMTLLSIAVAGSLAAAAAAPAIPVQPTSQQFEAKLMQVQYRRGCYAGERPGDCRERLRWERRHNRHYEWRDGRYYEHRRDDDAGAAIAGAILGFVLGAAISGSQNDYDRYYSQRDDRDWRARCQARYRSFDWRSGTYLSRDGYRRYCTL
jgi:hypothetical protein